MDEQKKKLQNAMIGVGMRQVPCPICHSSDAWESALDCVVKCVHCMCEYDPSTDSVELIELRDLD